MKARLPFVAMLALLAAAPALAQPADLPIAAATTTQYPPGVAVAKAGKGEVYVDDEGRTLYGMDMRVLLRWSPNAALYCKDRCADWEPLLAPAGSQPNIAFPAGFGERPQPGRPVEAVSITGSAPKPNAMITPQKAPDWTIIDGPAGPQWVYKGWHMVYVRKGDRPHQTTHEGEGEGDSQMVWNTLKFVPPVPTVEAPMGIKPLFVAGAYALTDKDGHLLFTGACKATGSGACDDWNPLPGGIASSGLQEWKVAPGTIGAAADRAQWHYRGRPVFVAVSDDPKLIPPGGSVLRP
jgi:predicted lipoprotein with Yx(FWY)xxD motif